MLAPTSELSPMIADYAQQLRALQRSPLTVRRYLQALDDLLAINTNLLALPAATLQRLLTQKHAQGLAPRTLATQRAAWRCFYDWAQRQGLRADNPCTGLRTPKIPRALPKAFSADAGEVYFGRAGDVPTPTHEGQLPAMALRDQAVLELLYACGLRAAELLSLDAAPGRHAAGYVDFAACHVHVTGKGNKLRAVPIIPVAVTALQAWLAVRDTLAAPTETALFVGTRGGRLSGTELRRLTQRQVTKQGFNQPVHPHMLRHSFASHLLQSSGDLRAVQELLGHSSITSTQIYTQLDFQHLAKIYDEKHPRAKRKVAAGAALVQTASAELD